MTVRFRLCAAAGALAAGILGACLSVPATAYAAPGSALPSPLVEHYGQGFQQGLLAGDTAASTQCAYEATLDYEGPHPKPTGIPSDPGKVVAPAGHGEDWSRGYREGFQHGWTDGLPYYCAHGS